MEQRINIQGIDIDPIADFNVNWVKEGVAQKEFIDFADKFGNILANLHEHKKEKSLTIKIPKDDYEKKKFKAQNLSSSQIRNFFSTIKTLEMNQKDFKSPQFQTRLYMLKPLLAYAFKRNSSKAFEYFYHNIIKMLDLIYDEKIDQEQYFKNFCRIVEAILAYHKAHGGN